MLKWFLELNNNKMYNTQKLYKHQKHDLQENHAIWILLILDLLSYFLSLCPLHYSFHFLSIMVRKWRRHHFCFDYWSGSRETNRTKAPYGYNEIKTVHFFFLLPSILFFIFCLTLIDPRIMTSNYCTCFQIT